MLTFDVSDLVAWRRYCMVPTEVVKIGESQMMRVGLNECILGLDQMRGWY